MGPPIISVVIPILNEAAILPAVLRSCHREGADQVLIANAGSKDEAEEVAAGFGHQVLHVAPPQRARQMNAAARVATGDLLVFLHADTIFEAGALDELRRAALDHRIVGGGFQRRFRPASPLLRMSCQIGNLRARYLGWYFGDQAIWARRDAFQRVNGFPEVPIFEDLDFSRKLRCLGRTHLVFPGCHTSSRRFHHGTLSRLTKDILLTVRHVSLDSTP